MCDTCGCNDLAVRTIDVNERLLASDAAVAEHNRAHLDERKVFAINLMGTPGAGKTALLEATIAQWRGFRRITVIEGDQATDRDSARIRAAGATACQVETGLGCHLDAHQIHDALRWAPAPRPTPTWSLPGAIAGASRALKNELFESFLLFQPT